MTFKRYSETNPNALKELKPDLGLRHWDDLGKDERGKIWSYLDNYFFKRTLKADWYFSYDLFKGSEYERHLKAERISMSILNLNVNFKLKSFGKRFLEFNSIENACDDFYDIFTNQPIEVVFELISFYCENMILQQEHYLRNNNYEQAKLSEILNEYRWTTFDTFCIDLNETFSHFGVNSVLTRTGFIPRQEEKITEEIYKPVLKFFSDSKWKSVNQHLSDAFSDFKNNTPDGYSGCVTKTVTAIQAYLQIIVNGEIGSGDISKLIPQAQSKKLIPDDPFTKKIFENIESILMRERQETGDAHPKKEYANEKNARMLLNITMVFFQHCIQK